LFASERLFRAGKQRVFVTIGNRAQIKQRDGGDSGESGKHQPGDYCYSAHDR